MIRKERKLLVIGMLLTLIITIIPKTNINAVFTTQDCPYNIKFSEISSMPNYGEEGSQHTLALDENGNIWAWGNNKRGQLGTGTKEDMYYVPTQITGINGNNMVYTNISAGVNFSVAIDENGDIWTWGNNFEKQLGLGELSEIEYEMLTPTKITTGTKYVQVATYGRLGAIAIDEQGNLWGWGTNALGILGDGSYDSEFIAEEILEPRITRAGMNFKYIKSGNKCIYAVDEAGSLWATGSNKKGQLGIDTSVEHSDWIKVPISTKIKKVEISNYYQVIALDENGDIWSWGETQEPTPILSNTKIKDIASSSDTFFALRSDGQYGYKWNQDTAKPTDGIWEQPYSSIYSGDEIIYYLDNEKELYSAGNNYYGVFGIGTEGIPFEYYDGTYSRDDARIYKAVKITQTRYTITFNVNGGNINSGEVNEYTKGSEVNLPTDVTKEGYTFEGWYENSDFSGSVVTKVTQQDTGNKTYYAKWTANTANYTIKHYKQETNLTEYKLVETETKQGIVGATATAGVKTSYIEEGFKENNTHPNRLKTGEVNSNGTLELRIYYDRMDYTITLNTNGGTINSGDVKRYKYGIGATLPTDVTKEGYTFEGWYNNSEFSESNVTSISETETGARTYYAKWIKVEEIPFSITSSEYKIENQAKYICKVNQSTTVNEFTNKITTNGSMKVIDSEGEILQNSSLLKTGYKLQVEYKGETYEYEIAVRGDIDCDGKVTVTDLSTLNQAILHKITLTGILEKSSDIDCDGQITVTDLSTLNQIIIGTIKI